MTQDSWTWDDRVHSRLSRVVEDALGGLEWCDLIEAAPEAPVVGKVLCVCIAVAIAREVLAAETMPDGIQATPGPLDLLARWIDEPTDERFGQICAIAFDEGQSPSYPDPHGVVWWALRTATSSVGNYEAGWALESLCNSVLAGGFSVEALKGIASRELRSRRRRPS